MVPISVSPFGQCCGQAGYPPLNGTMHQTADTLQLRELQQALTLGEWECPAIRRGIRRARRRQVDGLRGSFRSLLLTALDGDLEGFAPDDLAAVVQVCRLRFSNHTEPRCASDRKETRAGAVSPD